MVVSVLLAGALRLMRGALAALLAGEKDIEIVAELARCDRIVPVALALRPQVAVIDIDPLGTDGIVATAQLQARLPECRTVILTNLCKPGDIRRVLSVQAYGYLGKDAPPPHLAETIRRVARGERVVDLDIPAALLRPETNPLSRREREVLQLAAEGAPVSEIADRLCLTAGTVRNYLSITVGKTGARGRVDAIRIADEAGWL